MKEHSCLENNKLSGEFQFDGDCVFFFGECGICGKKTVETYAYANTKEQNTDKDLGD